ncbi:DUF1707 SHOCT-like domain-containing protein [Actinophytocola sediminis]
MAEIRISAGERADALSALGAHHASGRLPRAEYDRRLLLAGEAVFRHELEAVFADLPAPHPDLSSSVSPRRPIEIHPEWPGGRSDTRMSKVMDAIGVLTLLVGLPTAIVLTVVSGLWWMFIVVPVVAAVAMVLGVAFMDRDQPT